MLACFSKGRMLLIRAAKSKHSNSLSVCTVGHEWDLDKDQQLSTENLLCSI